MGDISGASCIYVAYGASIICVGERGESVGAYIVYISRTVYDDDIYVYTWYMVYSYMLDMVIQLVLVLVYVLLVVVVFVYVVVVVLVLV